MKCPKCGYVSFEYLDQCKKCGKSLEAFKSKHGFYGYPPDDLMLVEYLEEKARAEEEAAVEETEEAGVITAVGEEGENLESIVSHIEGVTKNFESSEESAGEITLDLEELDETVDEAKKITANLVESEESLAEKDTGEIELTLDGTEGEEIKAPAPTEEPAEEITLSTEEIESPGEEAEEITLELEESEAKESDEIELSLDDVEIEEPKELTPPAPIENKDSKDEITLDLGEIDVDLEIDDDIKIEKPKPKKKDDDDSDDEIKLELE